MLGEVAENREGDRGGPATPPSGGSPGSLAPELAQRPEDKVTIHQEASSELELAELGREDSNLQLPG